MMMGAFSNMNIKETLQSFSTMTLSERQALMLQHSDWLLQEMLAHISSVDAELRDHLIYRTFIELLSDNLLTPQQLHYLFETAISEDFLYLHIGEKATDSVFTRSFSALLVAGLLAKDAELLVLNDDDLHIFFKKSDAIYYWSKI